MSTTNRALPFSSETILSRQRPLPSYQNSGETSLQKRADQLVSGFVDQATDWKTLAALTAGGFAYRYGKIGVMALGEGHVAAMPLRPLSIALGLGSEVTAFEFTNRTLHTFRATGQSPHQDIHPNLWNWSGPGGWKQSLVTDLITFGTLKGAGYLSRESNVILQHSFASAAMVAGHQTSAQFGIVPKPEGNLAEQFLHAEVTNIQLGTGTSLVHAVAPGISALERGLDLSLQPRVRAHGRAPLQWESQWALAGGPKDSLNAGFSLDPIQNLPTAPKGPPTFFMEGDSEGRTYGKLGVDKEPLSLGRMISILSRFHEIPKKDLPPVTLRTGQYEIRLPRFSEYQVFGQLLRNLQSLKLPPLLSASLRNILWGFDPPPDGASQEEVEMAMTDLSRELFVFYSANRNQIYSLSQEEALDFGEVQKRDEASFDPFWELGAFPDNRIAAYQMQTESIFSYLSKNDSSLWTIYYRISGEDVNRMLVTPKVLEDIQNALKTDKEFSFPVSKDHPQSSPLTLEKESYLGASPISAYTLMQLGLESILSPPLFKAVFGLMDYTLTFEPNSYLAHEVKKDLQRCALFFLIGADEARLLDDFRERILKKYYQNRESFIDRIDFLRYEENFLLLPDRSPTEHMLSRELREALLRFVVESNLPLYVNHDSISVLGLIRRIYQARNQHLIHQLHYLAPKDEPAEIPSWIARFYFEHQKEILDLLRKNGEIQ